MGAIIVNAVLLAVAVGVLVMSARTRTLARRKPRPRPDYVPPFWSAGPWTDWLSSNPGRMFCYLVLLPLAGLIAGVVLLATHDGFGRVLILASLIGAWRVHGSARRAIRAARRPHGESPRDSG